MATRAATREFSHFLVRYDDGTLYACPRVKVNIEGLVRIGEHYSVTYGSSSDTPETVEVLDTGDYLTMKSRETELSSTQTPPSLTSTPESPESLPNSPFLIAISLSTASIPSLCSNSTIANISAPTPPTSTSATTQTTPTDKEPNAFSIQHSLLAMEKQLKISNTRLAEMERMITAQGNMIKELVSKSQHVTPLPLTLVPPLTPSTLTTPRFPQVMPDLPLTPTMTQLPDSPLPQPLTPTLHRRILPVHLFNDLPESVRLSEDDLNRLSCSGNNPGAYGVLLLKHFYPELFTADQLRVYYSYRGGGKLSKRPLDDSRKAIIKRYVVALFPSVNTESTYHAMVVEKNKPGGQLSYLRQESLVSDHEMTDDVPEFSSKTTVESQPDHAKECLDELVLSQETYQSLAGEAPFLEAELYPESLKDNTLKTLLEIHSKADTWMFRRQVLSILTEQLNYDASTKMIPNITQWRYYEAERHTDKSGAGQPVQPSKQQREKFDAKWLEHFIDFITSNQIIKDLPFGDKPLRLSTGEIRNIPNVVRSIAPVSIIKQYNQLCEEDQIKPLGDTSTESKTSGGKAIPKTDMKIHVRQTSIVADHCAPYALSTSNSCFKVVCDNEHDSRCILLTRITGNTRENRDSVLYIVEKAIDDIKEWKKHLVRARNQEEARRNITENMNENEALITFDWAMKFLPRKYREGQVDWYAKREINRHISVSLMKKGIAFESITHVHIFENPTSQDADVTSEIMVDVVSDLVKVLPTLNKFHLFSDNTGCPCDRKASHINSSIKRYVNEGHDVITAQQMKQVVIVKLGAKILKCNIPDITALHNFKFTDDALVVWKAYNIGEGKKIIWTQLKSNINKELSVILDWRDVAFTRIQEDENESTEMNTQIKKRAIFMCPIEGCVREFSTYSNLDNHLLLGNCDYKLKKQCLTDLAITIYSKKINEGFPPSTSGQS
ncbi:unnamed protein product [Mytilus coruscus]|uniref:BEN domain-containing protein n=1 Tax=Mytilus coruscus TaxID=42192 RepID=A0A6J8B7Y5_MYTCO|nr:unnamed protein product [Mytilus coruscus]